MLRDGNLVGFWKVLNKGKCQGSKSVLGDKNYQINRYITKNSIQGFYKKNIIFLYKKYLDVRCSLYRALNNLIRLITNTSNIRLIIYRAAFLI